MEILVELRQCCKRRPDYLPNFQVEAARDPFAGAIQRHFFRTRSFWPRNRRWVSDNINRKWAPRSRPEILLHKSRALWPRCCENLDSWVDLSPVMFEWPIIATVDLRCWSKYNFGINFIHNNSVWEDSRIQLTIHFIEGFAHQSEKFWPKRNFWRAWWPICRENVYFLAAEARSAAKFTIATILEKIHVWRYFSRGYFQAKVPIHSEWSEI